MPGISCHPENCAAGSLHETRRKKRIEIDLAKANLDAAKALEDPEQIFQWNRYVEYLQKEITGINVRLETATDACPKCHFLLD